MYQCIGAPANLSSLYCFAFCHVNFKIDQLSSYLQTLGLGALPYKKDGYWSEIL